MDRDKLLSLAVAREQSFTRAAAKPGVPQSAAELNRQGSAPPISGRRHRYLPPPILCFGAGADVVDRGKALPAYIPMGFKPCAIGLAALFQEAKISCDSLDLLPVQ